MESPPGATVPAMQFPDGSLALKAAWVDMTGFSEAQTRRDLRLADEIDSRGGDVHGSERPA